MQVQVRFMRIRILVHNCEFINILVKHIGNPAKLYLLTVR